MSNNDLPQFPYEAYLAFMNERIDKKNNEIKNVQDSLKNHAKAYFDSLLNYFESTKDCTKAKKDARVAFIEYLINVFNQFGFGPMPEAVYNSLYLSVVSKIFETTIRPFSPTAPWYEIYPIFSLHNNISSKDINYELCTRNAKVIKELVGQSFCLVSDLRKLKAIVEDVSRNF